MDKNFYITTPIYYPSAKPHMGHAYSSIVADVFARFKNIDGYQVYFLTGTDEHGLKIQRAAENKGVETSKFCDEISKTFKDLSKTLNLSNTDFIRTTENRHKKSVQHLWNELTKNDLEIVSNTNTTSNKKESRLCQSLFMHKESLGIQFESDELKVIEKAATSFLR